MSVLEEGKWVAYERHKMWTQPACKLQATVALFKKALRSVVEKVMTLLPDLECTMYEKGLLQR